MRAGCLVTRLVAVMNAEAPKANRKSKMENGKS